jgi:hypothetical protein
VFFKKRKSYEARKRVRKRKTSSEIMAMAIVALVREGREPVRKEEEKS